MTGRRVWVWTVVLLLLTVSCLRAQESVQQVAAQEGGVAQATATGTVVPRLVQFSGTLTDSAGKPATGAVTVTFSLYELQQGGASLWSETQTLSLDSQGHYTAFLGAASPEGLPLDVFASGSARWLGVAPAIPAVGEQPRVLLVGVPYALKAADADTLGGKPASAFVTVGGQSSTAGSGNPAAPASSRLAVLPLQAAPPSCSGCTANFVPLLTDSAGDLTDSTIFQSTSGNVGFGITTPGAKLDVKGGAIVRGTLELPSTGTATATKGFNSQPFDLLGSVFNSSVNEAVSQHFRWQAEPVGNNTSSASGSLNLLFASGTGTLTETGLSIASSGIVSFPAAQTFPDTASLGANSFNGSQSVTGNVTATGTVTGSAASFSGSITAASFTGNGAGLTSVNAALLDDMPSTAFQPVGSYATLAANTFGGTQTIASGDVSISNGNLDLPGTTGATAGVITLGGTPFLQACCNANGYSNTFVGSGAGNFTDSVLYNTGVGYQALSANAGYGNTAVGYQALYANTTGQANMAGGNEALVANTTGIENTGVGTQALEANTTGNSNTAIGLGALEANTTGGNNTALGAIAGATVKTCSVSTFVGSGATATVDGLTNASAFGYSAEVAESNALVLGSPQSVNGLANTKVGIDVAGPSNIFTVLQGGGPAIADGWNTYSSRRWKSNILPLHGALGKVERLRGVSYTYNANGKRDIGMIAEEVGKVVPEVVSYEDNGKDAQGIDYARLTALLVEAIKQQQGEIREQQVQISHLRSEVRRLAHNGTAPFRQ